MTAPESNTFLKRVRAIRDFVARHIDSGVARESKKASCAALRSNASKNAFVKSSKNASRKACGSCTSRALLSLFVASATLLATFVIAPTSALSAGSNTTVTEKTEGEKAGSTKSGSVKDDGESNKQQTEQSESNNNTEPNKKNTGSSSTLTNNKESKPVEKQNSDSNKVDDKAKSTDSAVKKNVKDAKNKAADSAKAVNGTDRSVKDAGLSEECGSKPFKRCYVVSYYNDKIVVDNNHPVLIQPGNTITIKPKFKIKSTNKQADMPSGVWFKLEQYLKYPVPSWANFEKDNGATKVKDTSKDKTGFDGSVKLRPGKWDRGSYKFKVYAYYESEKIYATISVKVDVSDVQNDLKLSLYDFVNKQAGAQIKDNKIIINPKPKGVAGDTTSGTDNTDTYDPINKLFIDSKSIKKPGFIYHRMICKTGSDDNASYTVGSVNGLSLGTQTQFKHKENKDRPKPPQVADNSALYEDDKYTEESQSWISGTPTKSGTFVCEVFALKPSELKIEEYISGAKFPKVKETSTMIKEFDERVKTNKDMKLLFDDPKQNIVEDKWTNKADIQQGIDWDYKSVTIEVKSNKPPEPKPPEIGDNDLTLKVYPFKDSTTALTSDNNKISAILGMSLKPFVDATSAADSANKITLRVLCSKGEKKNNNAAGSSSSTGSTGSSGSGSAVSGSSGDISSTGSNGANAAAGSFSSTQSGSKSEQSSGSSQPAEDPEYKTWSSNLAELGLSVPADDNQNTCHSDKEGEKTCVSADSKTNVAARTDKEVSIKPTKVGNYQCVVFALKPKALAKFDGLTGTLTPDSIKSALTTAKPTAFKENKDFATFAFNLHSVSKFTLPHTGGQSWNLQLGILAALLVNLLAAGFVVSQSERGRKLILGRWRGLCNHV
ncbi:hypothetical protein ACMZ9N_03945 [Gardnerella vaginalis]|uniref:hypothetical protein n=1 Tax=Gardnerella vaginalis TaxID=2702 RepID=UPI0039F13060